MRLGDRRAPDDEVAVEQTRGLARRHPVGGLGERELQLVVLAGGHRLDPAGERA